ncbi:hypothetical protein M409DRAFT_24227 [Zasmidium cellare ATCC 36951]|uniref:SnoaL-like domain-containing protein n=1 Tax=Zasmidium cellare ATCC 36951 TaxID=1080233 RepID=A0A6A6CDR4_ZASCE|nr:uncharacterized protein M409DRAFT_24227 [Zasmidium cellare ATCC 36951]KAF2165377.1 hypothetical protein M409DRAFT_24227 [Zasmidium cellare ATCC 36951]
MAADPWTQPHTLPNLTPKEGILDAINRITWGLDLHDRALFKSAFSTQGTPKLHFPFRQLDLSGRDEISTKFFNGVKYHETDHQISNVRISYEAGRKEARVWAMGQNQHHNKGEALKTRVEGRMTGARYVFDVVEDSDEVWRVMEWWVEITWEGGDPSVVGKVE